MSFGAWRMSVQELHRRPISLGVVPSVPLSPSYLLIWSEFTVYSHVRCLTVHDFKSSARRTRCFAGDSPFLCCLCFRQLLSTCTPRTLPDNGRGQTGRLLRIHGSKVVVLSVPCSCHLFYKRDECLPIIEKARIALFGDHKPTDVVLGVATLSPDYLIEVDAIAIID